MFSQYILILIWIGFMALISNFIYMKRFELVCGEEVKRYRWIYSIRQMIKKYTQRAGIERNITPHMFRHSFATYLIEEGVDVSCVQQILGHSSIKTTQIYIHIAARKQAEILREMHPRNSMNIIRAA